MVFGKQSGFLIRQQVADELEFYYYCQFAILKQYVLLIFQQVVVATGLLWNIAIEKIEK